MINLLSTARERAVTHFITAHRPDPSPQYAQYHPMDCVAACLRLLGPAVPTAPETGLSLKEAELFAALGGLHLADQYEWDLVSCGAPYVILGFFDGPLGPHANLFLVQPSGITQFEPTNGSFTFYESWNAVGITTFDHMKVVYMA